MMLCTLQINKGVLNPQLKYWHPFVVLYDGRSDIFLAKKAKVRFLENIDFKLDNQFNAEVSIDIQNQIHCDKSYFIFDTTISGTMIPYLKRED